MEIKIEKLNKSYSVQTITGKEIGSFQLDSNGSYYFWEKSDLSGCWSAYTLRAIADKLDEVNKPFEKELELYFGKENDKLKIDDLNVDF
jgi:hypothetical protein